MSSVILATNASLMLGLCSHSVSSPQELSLISSMLHNFTQLCEVVIVVDPQEQLGQVRRTLVIVLEV